MPKVSIGMKIRKLRQDKGWTQEVLAKRATIDRVHLTQIETGVRVNPTIQTRKKLAKALGVPITELLD
jgi:transcriptional regulator with XRE-family HTH domain